jgi:hypothetical protein
MTNAVKLKRLEDAFGLLKVHFTFYNLTKSK